ncbi:unnamed protein product [Oppiella nova]|uniref:Uncharacterized protein n=1 Tax=Oppiella nova TaxID=334625 RepID=A0A7R9MC03_9ACAR|nr:unnamed protein product [Oppiella nova]CAG2174099.1 unnamed protein product [Oppiella nova]
MLMPSLNSCVNPWIVLFFNKNLVKTLTETFRRCRCANRCHKTEYINQIEEYTSNCEDTRYSSQTDIEFINNSNIFVNKKRSVDLIHHKHLPNGNSQSNHLLVPHNILVTNHLRKQSPKSAKNGNLSVDCRRTRRKSSSELNSIPNNKAIEMQTICIQNDL